MKILNIEDNNCRQNFSKAIKLFDTSVVSEGSAQPELLLRIPISKSDNYNKFKEIVLFLSLLL